MADQVLSWEIFPSEKKSQVKKFILRTCLLILGLIFLFLFYENYFLLWLSYQELEPVLNKFFYLLIGVIIFIWLFSLFNILIPEKLRTYLLDDKGLTISKGKKKKIFTWDKFECFYAYRFYQEAQRRSKESGRKNKHQIFYLKVKKTGFSSNFYKTFVIIYTKPDQTNQVLVFLKDRLPQIKMTLGTDVGLIFYQFK